MKAALLAVSKALRKVTMLADQRGCNWVVELGCLMDSSLVDKMGPARDLSMVVC